MEIHKEGKLVEKSQRMKHALRTEHGQLLTGALLVGQMGWVPGVAQGSLARPCACHAARKRCCPAPPVCSAPAGRMPCRPGPGTRHPRSYQRLGTLQQTEVRNEHRRGMWVYSDLVKGRCAFTDLSGQTYTGWLTLLAS